MGRTEVRPYPRHPGQRRPAEANRGRCITITEWMDVPRGSECVAVERANWGPLRPWERAARARGIGAGIILRRFDTYGNVERFRWQRNSDASGVPPGVESPRGRFPGGGGPLEWRGVALQYVLLHSKHILLYQFLLKNITEYFTRGAVLKGTAPRENNHWS